MGKRGKKNDVTATQSNPVLRALKPKKAADPDRLAKDIAIIDNGWNNTAEGQAHLATGTKKSGKHAK